MFPDHLATAARAFLDRAKRHGLKLVTAESCTGGLIAACVAEIPGASAVLERGFVTYSNSAKIEMLGVPAPMIAAKGAVSAETARAMAEGALKHSRADLAVAVTGVAGPDGGSEEKPVGLVHFAAARKNGVVLSEEHRFGDIGRINVQAKSVMVAFNLLARLMD
jgi:nicotinamide-nucleotide amidase